MKKILLVLAAFFFAVGLAGCDFNTQDIEEISEQYCRDNPTSEICEGDPVGDLQDEAVINVFNTILEEYNDPENDTFCEDYFSVTNITLLDECRADRTDLFPEDFVGFSVTDVEKQASLSNQDTYLVTTVNEDMTDSYIFTITLTLVEGTMFISSWSYTQETIEPEPLVMTLEIAQAFFEQFILDYLNQAITSTTICSTYFGDQDQTECASDRDESLLSEMTAELDSFVASGDNFIAGILMGDKDNTPAVELNEVIIQYNDAGDIVMTFVDDNDQSDYDRFKQMDIDLLVEFNAATDPLDVCTKYFIPDDVENCKLGHTEKVEKGYTIEFIDFIEEDDYYLLTIEFVYPNTNDNQTVTIKQWFIQIDGEWKIDQDMDNIGGEDFEQFLFDLIADYQNPDLSIIQVCGYYLDPQDFAGCLESHDQLLEDDGTITVQGFMPFEDHFKATFVYDFPGEENDKSEEMHIFFFHDNDGNLKVHIDGGENYDRFERYHQFIKDLIADFQDSSLVINDVCAEYLNPEDLDGCLEGHTDLIDRNGVLTLGDFWEEEGVFRADFIYDFPNDEDDETMKVYLFFMEDADGNIKVKIDGENNQPNPEYYNFIMDLIFDFNDSTQADQDVCGRYFHQDMIEGCMERRQQMVTEGETIRLGYFYTEDQGKYFVEFVYEGLNYSYSEEVIAVFYIDDNNNLYITFENNNYFDPYKFMENLIFDFNDDLKSHEDVCNIYFEEEEDAQGCVERRTAMFAAGETIALGYFYNNQFNQYFIEFIFVGVDTYTEEVVGYFFGNENGDPKLHFEDNDYIDIEWDDAQAFIDELVTAANDEFIDDYTLVFTYIYHNSHDLFRNFRSNFMNEGNPISFYWLYEEYGQYSFEFELQNGTKQFYYVFFHTENDKIYAELFEKGPDNVDEESARGFANMIVDMINNRDMDPNSICRQFFNEESQQNCMNQIGFFYNENIMLEYINLNMMEQHYSIEFKLMWQDNNGKEEMRNWDVIIFYVEDGIMASFTDNGPKIPLNEKENVVTNFLIDFNDSSLTDDAVCSLFITPDSYQECTSLRSELRDSEFTMVIQSRNLEFYSYNIVFAVVDEYENPQFFISYEIDFLFNQNGDLQILLRHSYRYTTVTEGTAQFKIHAIFNRFNDLETSDDAVCQEIGYIFHDCYGLRNRLRMNNESLDVIDIITHDNGTDFEVSAMITDNEGTLVEYAGFYFNITRDNFGNVQLWGHQKDMFIPQYSLEEVDGAFRIFMEAYFNDTYTPEQLIDMIGDGNYLFGLEHREQLLSRGIVVNVISVEFDPFGEHETYKGLVEVYEGDGSYQTEIMFTVWMGSNALIINLEPHFMMPPQQELQDFSTMMISDFANTEISNEDFCLMYFMNWDYSNCTDLRDDVFANEYTMSQFSIFNDEYNAYLEVQFTNTEDVFISTLRLDFMPEYNIIGESRLLFFIQGSNADMIHKGTNFMDGLITDLNNGTITINDFCTMYNSCSMEFNGSEVIRYGYYTFVNQNFEDFFNIHLQTEIVWQFADGNIEYHKYILHYTENNDGTISFSLEYVGKDIEVPLDATLLDEANTIIVLDQFILDIVDPLVTNEVLCDTYFAGAMQSFECIEGRTEMVTGEAVIAYTPLVLNYDEYNNFTYYTTFTITYADEVEEIYTNLLIYVLPDSSNYIDFNN